jgi:hypothetical protein
MSWIEHQVAILQIFLFLGIFVLERYLESTNTMLMTSRKKFCLQRKTSKKPAADFL